MHPRYGALFPSPPTPPHPDSPHTPRHIASRAHAPRETDTPAHHSQQLTNEATMGITTTLAAYSTVSFASLLATYLVFTGSGTQFNPGAFLEDTSPYAWALMGIGLNIGLSVVGAGWCVPLSLWLASSRGH